MLDINEIWKILLVGSFIWALPLIIKLLISNHATMLIGVVCFVFIIAIIPDQANTLILLILIGLPFILLFFAFAVSMQCEIRSLKSWHEHWTESWIESWSKAWKGIDKNTNDNCKK